MASSEASRGSVGRRKVRIACVPCKDRKRRCNGEHPCSTCLRYEYDCRYANRISKPMSSTSPDEKAADGAPSFVSTAATNLNHTQAPFSITQAISGAAFARAVGVSHAVPQISTAIGWNLGPPRGMKEIAEPNFQPLAVSTLITEQDLCDRIRHYHSMVGTLYPIVSLQTALSLAQHIYQQAVEHVRPLLDGILSVILALSHYFSVETDHERFLVSTRNAKRCLDICAEEEPTELHIMAWALYTILLRATGSGHMCWMASCTAIHVLDITLAAKQQAHSDLLLPCGEKETLMWTTRLLNLWVSFELGRPRLVEEDTFAEDPGLSAIANRNKLSVLGLYALTRSISPDQSSDPKRLEESFSSIEAFDCGESHALSLSRCILAMTTFRRRLIEQPPVEVSLKNRVIGIGKQGLLSVEHLSHYSAPWWHLANLPLQFLCILLVTGALTEVPAAMRTLRAVASKYPTDSTRNTLAFAERMLYATYTQKLADCRLLEEGLGNMQDVRFEEERSNESLATAAASTTWDLPVAMDNLNWDLFPNTGISIFDFSIP